MFGVAISTLLAPLRPPLLLLHLVENKQQQKQPYVNTGTVPVDVSGTMEHLSVPLSEIALIPGWPDPLNLLKCHVLSSDCVLFNFMI